MSIFISYNSSNRAFVKPIVQDLKKLGYDVYFDVESLIGGDVWIKKISEGIEKSSVFLIFIGEDGISNFQCKEIIFIEKKKKSNENIKIIPIILPSANQCISLSNSEWIIADYEWIEYTDTDYSFTLQKIIESINVTLEFSKRFIGKNPYKGLSSFEVEDDYCFFGRRWEINKVIHENLRFHISIKGNNFLAVVANSGVGKSSFVKAGLMATLKNGYFKGSENWKQLIFKPGSSPLSALSSTLYQVKLISNTRIFEEESKEHYDTLQRLIRDQRETWVIYIDQFEEVISQCKNEIERTSFLNNIANSVNEEKIILLLSLRSDFYTSFTKYDRFKHLLEKNNYTLPAIEAQYLDENKFKYLLSQIITRPAIYAGIKLDSGLKDTLIQQLTKVNGSLPILQLALEMLWERRVDNDITSEQFHLLTEGKSIEGIIQNHADNVYNNITNYGKDKRMSELFRNIFVPNLVDINSQGNDLRKTTKKEDLYNIKGFSKEEIEEMLDKLSDKSSRLITISDGGAKVEVIHEVIIREWKLLQDWINLKREAIEYFKWLNFNAERYFKGQAQLFDLKRIVEFKKWQKINPELNNSIIENFIAESELTHAAIDSRRMIIATLISIFLFLCIIIILSNSK